MINLAKTPANIDFQSKYYKPQTSAAVKSLDSKFEDKNNSLPSSPTKDSSQSESSNQRHNISLVRGSKSEDQLLDALSELENNSSEEEKLLLNSSCHTLLDTSQRPGAPHVSSESSSTRSVLSNDNRLPLRVSFVPKLY